MSEPRSRGLSKTSSWAPGLHTPRAPCTPRRHRRLVLTSLAQLAASKDFWPTSARFWETLGFTSLSLAAERRDQAESEAMLASQGRTRPEPGPVLEPALPFWISAWANTRNWIRLADSNCALSVGHHLHLQHHPFQFPAGHPSLPSANVTTGSFIGLQWLAWCKLRQPHVAQFGIAEGHVGMAYMSCVLLAFATSGYPRRIGSIQSAIKPSRCSDKH